MSVIDLRTGKEIRWNDTSHWDPQTRARWSKKTMYGDEVKGSVRGIAHIDLLDRRARTVFGPEHPVVVIQSAFNDTVKASAGTHNLDLVYDLHIPGIGWWRQQRFFRAHGFPGWYRPTTPGLWLNHYHGWSMVPFKAGSDPSKAFMNHGFKVGVYIDGGWSTYGRLVASSQAHDQAVHAFGLSEQHTPGSDHSWFPFEPSARTFDLHAYVQRRARLQAA